MTQPPALQNLVGTVDFGRRFILAPLAAALGDVDYNGEKFAAITVRLNDPRATVLVFGSGKVVVTGAKSHFAAMCAVSYMRSRFKDLGFRIAPRAFQVQNMVASASVGHPISLERLCDSYG